MATGGELTVLSKDSVRELDGFLSAHWSHSNPVDVLADADAERFVKAVDIASKDPASDGLLAIIAPQGLANPKQVAERMKPLAHSTGKPLPERTVRLYDVHWASATPPLSVPIATYRPCRG